jgi:hypothetical protein
MKHSQLQQQTNFILSTKRILSVFLNVQARQKTKEEFISLYVAQLRDFNTAGVVAAHHGTPLSKMKQNYYPVHSDPEVKVNADQIRLGRKAIEGLVGRLDT